MSNFLFIIFNRVQYLSTRKLNDNHKMHDIFVIFSVAYDQKYSERY